MPGAQILLCPGLTQAPHPPGSNSQPRPKQTQGLSGKHPLTPTGLALLPSCLPGAPLRRRSAPHPFRLCIWGAVIAPQTPPSAALLILPQRRKPGRPCVTDGGCRWGWEAGVRSHPAAMRRWCGWRCCGWWLVALGVECGCRLSAAAGESGALSSLEVSRPLFLFLLRLCSWWVRRLVRVPRGAAVPSRSSWCALGIPACRACVGSARVACGRQRSAVVFRSSRVGVRSWPRVGASASGAWCRSELCQNQRYVA